MVLYFGLIIALIAQLDRASGYGPEGREFESSSARHKDFAKKQGLYFFANLLLCKKEEDSKRREQPKVAEKNSPVDCFCRRVPERCGSIGGNLLKSHKDFAKKQGLYFFVF